MGRIFDHSRFAKAFSMPGIDPRTWVSYGTIDRTTQDASSIQFKDAGGNPSPYGPLVNVTLQPSGISLPCRVAGAVAGDGEADWFPFVEGDEVVVVIPEGSERAGAIIIGRMNNEIDGWPTVVAGQDATKNTFGFRRMRTPYIVETAAAYLIRSATTGAQIGIDAQGNLILNDGDKGTLAIGPEALSLQSGDEEAFVTVFPPSSEVMLGAGGSSFLMNAKESKFISTGSVSFSTQGGASTGHAVTAEQVVGLLINLFTVLGVGGSFTAGPLATANFATPPQAIAAIVSVLQPAISAMAGPSPYAGSAGGNFAAFIGTLFGPTGALTLAMSNPAAQADPTGMTFGFARPGFKL